MKSFFCRVQKCDMARRFLKNEDDFALNKLCVCAICIINLIWFWPLIFQGDIMGDDIGVFSGSDFGNRALWQELLYQGSNRYRPVFELILNLYSRIFGNVYELYFVANLGLNIVISIQVFYLIKSITDNNYFISISGTILYILAPFSYYNILQVIGVMEGACLLFLVLMLRQLVNFWRGKTKRIYLVILFLTLLIFTHERYVVMAVWCAIIVFFSDHTSWKQKFVYSFFALCPLCLNIFLKEVVFGSRFMEGTAFAPIEFDIPRIISLFVCSMATILGLNIGPEYLNGVNFFMYHGWMKIAALFAMAVAFFLLCKYIVRVFSKPIIRRCLITDLKLFFIAASGIGALVLCSSVTIRVEMRWLYAPFILYLLYLMYITSKVKLCNFFRYALLTAMLFSTVLINYPYQKHIERIFFPKAMNITRNVYDCTVARYGESLKEYQLYFIGNHEAQWAVGYTGRSIFDVYFDEKAEFVFMDSVEQINADYCNIDPSNRKPIKVFKIDGTDLTTREMDTSIYGNKLLKPLTEYDFSISSLSMIGTSSDEAISHVDGIDFTMMSGYSNTVADVYFPKNAKLYLECAVPFGLADRIEISITLFTEDGERELTSFSVCSGKIDPQAVLVELNNQSELTGDVCIRAQSAGVDQSEDLLLFTRAGVYTN